MPMNAREYREHLYRQRSHPESYAKPSRDSFSLLYLSIVPFLVLEYYCELRFETIPSGLLFPTGFILFWAFYYTYQKPGVLESKLVSESKWDLFSVPTVLLGTVIWFVKVVVVELIELLLWGKVLGKKVKSNPRPVARPSVENPTSQTPELPRDISNALAVLGLRDCREWTVIHKRYRELAKKYHPDLNSDITSAGNRFMIYDGAYRKLASVKNRYFT